MVRTWRWRLIRVSDIVTTTCCVDVSFIFFTCRVLREVDGIKGEAMNLKEQMQMVKDDIKKVCKCLCFL